MIFVTVGTHEQPFDRLVKCIDDLKGQGNIQEDVIIQTGFSTYEPKNCEWSKMLPFSEMTKNVAEARIIITHGGPASFLMALQIGKIPIVVPRQKQLKEHVNDHQVLFSRAVAERMGNIIVVENMTGMEDAIRSYEETAASMAAAHKSNNSNFNAAFGKMVNGMMVDKEKKSQHGGQRWGRKK